MKFTSILKQVIMEQSRFEILRDALTKPTTDKQGEKQKPKMSIGEFLQIVQADPTTRLNNVDPETADSKELEKIKAGSYVQWIIKNYLAPKTERAPGDSGYEKEVKQVKETFMEDLYKVSDDLKKFERFKGAEMMYDGKDWRVIKIEDKGVVGKEAACYYGGNNKETRWCTSAPGASWFDRYIKDGPLYVIFNPNDTKIAPETGLPVERYQFHFPSNQFMDKDDRSVDLIKMLNGQMSELKNLFKPEFAKGLTVGGEKLVIDSFSHGAIGKFIGLYGLDDLIENLPDSLKEFQIQNRDTNNNIVITIPDSISRFQNLQMILLDNCIVNIPESICELPKLKFLALINNPGLKSIPECIGDLPNLFFLNLKGSENVKVPNSIQSRGTDMGNGMWDLQD